MANFKKPSKKTAIITVAILFVVAIISAAVLLKDRCLTKNVDFGTETEQVDRIGNAKTTTVETRTITGKITRAAMEKTTTTDNIQESTITKNETVIIERPWETKYITWSPIKIEAKLSLEDIITEKDEIIKFKSAKTAKVNGVEGATARVGDIITYTISVENLSKYTTGKAFIQDLELKKLTSGEKPILALTNEDGNSLEGKEIAEQLMEGTTVDVEPGKTTEFTFNTRVLRVDGAIKNTVIIRTPDYPIDPSNPEEPSVKVETADLTVLKEVENKQEEYKLGDTVTYKVTVTNNGSTTLTNIKVTDQLQGVELISNSDVIEKLETHESATVEYRYTIQEKDLGTDSKQGTVNNVAIAKASDGTTNSGSETIVTEEKNADFEIRKTSEIIRKGEGNTSDLAEVGDTIKYTIYVKNTGNVTLNGIVVTDVTMNKTSEPVNNLAPNTNQEVKALEFTHVVEKDDIELVTKSDGTKAAYVHNEAAAECDDPAQPGEKVTDETTDNEEARKDFNYTVNYYFDNELKYTENQPAEGTVELGTVIDASQVDTQTHKDIGYKIDSSKGIDGNGIVGAPLTISAVESENVINVYYVKIPAPEIRFTKTALNANKEKISNIVYNPDGVNTFYYRLKLENTVEGSYPATIAGPRTVTDILPEGITTYGTLPTGVSTENVTVEGIEREKITWTASDIGYGEAAQMVDISVKIDEQVFKAKREDLGTETTVLDIKLSQDGKDDKIAYTFDKSKTSMNLFIRGAGSTNKNDGYIYAGNITVGTKPNKTIYASDTYNSGTLIDNAIKSSTQLPDMLDDFVKANEDGTMSKYVNGGILPSKATINANLRTLYNNTIQLSDTQVILWYCTNVNDDSKLERYYKIEKDGRTLFNDYVTIPACTYHLDGIVVDISSLGTRIPAGAQVNVTNTATLVGISGNNDITSSTHVSLYYKQLISN